MYSGVDGLTRQATGVATTLLVFGRGLERRPDGFVLTGPTRARVRAAVRHVGAHADLFPAGDREPAGRIVFSGGWPEASNGAAPPPHGSREGDLMLRYALDLPIGADRLTDRVRLDVEAESRSTLENLLYVSRAGLLDGAGFTPASPLGLVAHRAHLRRIRYLAGKVLGLGRDSVQDIEADEVGSDATSGFLPEWTAYLVAHAMFAGTRDPVAMHHRERLMVRAMRRLDAARSGRRVRTTG